MVAVAHKQFKEYTADTITNYLMHKEVIIDIKNIVENPTWRL